MNEMIKISIVTPSYNQGEFIERTILSVLNQTYKNIEYIVIDGGSTDNTMDILNKYRDKIDIIISEKDKGQSDAINKGFRLATGKLAGWLNSDDILYPDCVEKIVELYNTHPDGSIYYPSTVDLVNKDEKLLFKKTHKITGKNYLLNCNPTTIQQGSFYNAGYLKKIDYVDKEIYYCMDLDLWIRLLDYGKIYYYEGKSLSAYRVWENTKTSSGGNDFLKNIRQTLNKYGAKKISICKLRLFIVRCQMLGGKIKRFGLLKK
jgi:glycosyltransferase involved in cell wall biosynthesis